MTAVRKALLSALVAGSGVVLATAAVSAPASAAPAASVAHGSERTCSATPAAGHATCFARVVTSAANKPMAGKPSATATPSGYGPADIRSAYKLTAAASGGKTVWFSLRTSRA